MSENLNRRRFVKATTLAASGLLAAAQAATAAPQPAVAPRSMGARFRALMNGPEPLICPGAFDIFVGASVRVARIQRCLYRQQRYQSGIRRPASASRRLASTGPWPTTNPTSGVMP